MENPVGRLIRLVLPGAAARKATLLAALVPLVWSACSKPAKNPSSSSSAKDSSARDSPIFGVEKEDGTLDFLDARGEAHTMKVDRAVPPSPYDRSAWSREGGRVLYGGEGFRVRQGLDISRHDGDVDWEKVAGAGYEFVFLRVGYRRYQAGTLHVDENFARNYEGARAAGLDVGVYVFSQAVSEAEAIEEADLVLRELEGRPLQLPVVFDPESILDDEARTDGVSPGQFTANTLAFCRKVRGAGFEPMLYANLMWEAYQLDMARLGGIPIWFADYEPVPQTPYAFTFWQWSAEGTVPGCTAQKTDLDVQLVPDAH